jgi:hypothetical protein
MSVSGLSDLLKNKYESLFHRSLEKTQVSNYTFTSTTTRNQVKSALSISK